jgi:hypothetical protein
VGNVINCSLEFIAMNTVSRVIDQQFRRLHESSLSFIRVLPIEILYKRPREPTSSVPIYSAGESLLRSAAAVEQTFGGLTENLWDDPFEWTLPETLSTPLAVEQYLLEVDKARDRGFTLIESDQDLYRRIAVPSGEPETLVEVLLKTLSRAWHHQGRAFSAFRMLSDTRFPDIAG